MQSMKSNTKKFVLTQMVEFERGDSVVFQIILKIRMNAGPKT